MLLAEGLEEQTPGYFGEAKEGGRKVGRMGGLQLPFLMEEGCAQESDKAVSLTELCTAAWRAALACPGGSSPLHDRNMGNQFAEAQKECVW